MTIGTGVNFDPIGAEIIFDRAKLEKLLAKELKPVCAKLQWSPTDRKNIISALAKCTKRTDKLFQLFGRAGIIGALFKIDAFELFWREFETNGQLHAQLMIGHDDISDVSEPKMKKTRSDGAELVALFRQVYHSQAALIGQLLARLNKFTMDEATLRWVFGLKGGFAQGEVKRILAPCLADIDQSAWCDFKPDYKVTKLTLLSSDSPSLDFVSLCGVTIRRGQHQLQAHESLLPLSSRLTVLDDLRNVAVGVAHKEPVLLVGACGSGKTHLVRYLAQQSNQELLCYQLSEETDAQSLLGGYVQAEDGSFKWRPGPLADAAQSGKWILLEDVHQAAGDCFPLIVQLIERQVLVIAGHGAPITPHANFQLFLTERTSAHSTLSNVAVLYPKVHLVKMDPNHNELEALEAVITAHHPQLQRTIQQIPIKVYQTLLAVVPQHTTSRKIGLRDVLKFAGRLARHAKCSNEKRVAYSIQDALDVFAEHFEKEKDKQVVVKRICDVHSANHQIVTAIAGTNAPSVQEPGAFFLSHYKPEITHDQCQLTVGRVTIAIGVELSDRELQRTNMVATTIHSRLMEHILVAVESNEPCLLVGETGTGKTSAVQYCAARLGRRLRVVNMSKQSQGSDLLGSFRPVDGATLMRPLFATFHALMVDTFSGTNDQFLAQMARALTNGQLKDVLIPAMKQIITKALGDQSNMDLLKGWMALKDKLIDLESRLKSGALSFAFVEGELAQAARNGDWLLLDELNLAPAELLESISGLLDSGMLAIPELGLIQPAPGFRLFSAMNPANDFAKKDLPDSLRARFTEFYVAEASNEVDIGQICGYYLPSLNAKIRKRLVQFYLKVRRERLRDMSGKAATFSLRTLSRALKCARDAFGDTIFGLFQSLQLAFMSGLDESTTALVKGLMEKYELIPKKTTGIRLPPPTTFDYITVNGFHLRAGDETPHVDEKFIITKTVATNVFNLSRAIASGKYAILIQGETSTGKTSLITYLAKQSGNKLIRINNHEHTDLQEYVGQYVPAADGRLIFAPGALVKAMKKGWWLLLDELNLAPPDVLEALNRVLDDNRELFIPETGETIKAHPRFQLFAAQNPAGVYGGRKQLSRAFTNRFVQMEFGELPTVELEEIVVKKCAIPPSKATKLVEAINALRNLRRDSAVFAGRNSFATLRDLFRWADRYGREQGELERDWDRHLALDGYYLLGGRCRSQVECDQVKETLETVFRRKLGDDADIYSRTQLEPLISHITNSQGRFVWGDKARRMALLLARALKFDEPVLLVGPTGCGKTTIVQMLSTGLKIINCHQQTEASDFLGGLRPVRGGADESDSKALFEWVDGPLVDQMKSGGSLLIDEISLADDSVLERLNSVLERERTLVLAEQGIAEVLTPVAGFQFIGTMNPGGDYGKKELSPALRNRLTEIWCQPPETDAELGKIMSVALVKGGIEIAQAETLVTAALAFVAHLKSSALGEYIVFSIRDALAYADYLIAFKSQSRQPASLVHAARAVHLDALGSGASLGAEAVREVRHQAEAFLRGLTAQYWSGFAVVDDKTESIEIDETHIKVDGFKFARGPIEPQIRNGVEIYSFVIEQLFTVATKIDLIYFAVGGSFF